MVFFKFHLKLLFHFIRSAILPKNLSIVIKLDRKLKARNVVQRIFLEVGNIKTIRVGSDGDFRKQVDPQQDFCKNV